MNLLVDTHILLWWLAGDTHLPPMAHRAISDPQNTAVVSAATLWEASIKSAIGRLRVHDSLPDAVRADGFDLLAITANHAWAAGALPRHHTDPFDRMLIAQAQIEDLPIITNDEVFDGYGVTRLW